MVAARVLLCSLLLLAVFDVKYHAQSQTKSTCSGRFFGTTRCLRKKFLTRRIAFYPDTTATFNPSFDLLICCGDLHPLPGPLASLRQRTSNLSVILLNARSLRNKLTDFQASIYSNDVDILVILPKRGLRPPSWIMKSFRVVTAFIVATGNKIEKAEAF